MGLKTLPELVAGWGENLDVARQLLRDRPDLARAVIQRGRMRLFDQGQADQIRQALADRREKQARSVMAPAMAG